MFTAAGVEVERVSHQGDKFVIGYVLSGICYILGVLIIALKSSKFSVLV